MRKAYKYRIYPNDEQKSQLSKIFGSCRFVYNKTLAYRKASYEQTQKIIPLKDCIAYYDQILKTENTWLADFDQQALINAIYHMDSAYRQFLRTKQGYPKFKSKHDSHKSYTTYAVNNNISIDFINGTLSLPMFSAIKATLHREFTGEIKSATVSQTSSGKYYVSFLTDSEHQEIPHTTKCITLDLNHKNSCITSDGTEYIYAKPISKYAKRLDLLQKQLMRKEHGSSNYYKLKRDIAICHERLSNASKDNLHKISHEIVEENQVINLEKPSIDNNISNELLKLLKYKSEWNQRTLNNRSGSN